MEGKPAKVFHAGETFQISADVVHLTTSGPDGALIDQLLAQAQNKDAESIPGESDLAGLLKKQLAERMLAAELTHHLADEAEAEQGKAGNNRNGTSPKTVMTPNGELSLDIPRDQQTTFEPQLVAKHQHRLPEFDDHVISMYARGMSVREIQGHLLDLYGLQVSPDLISTVTDEVLAEVEQWQQRPLEAMYPIVSFGKRLTAAVLRATVSGGNLVPTKYSGGNQSGRDCGWQERSTG
jgi:hypothetical protein